MKLKNRIIFHAFVSINFSLFSSDRYYTVAGGGAAAHHPVAAGRGQISSHAVVRDDVTIHQPVAVARGQKLGRGVNFFPNEAVSSVDLDIFTQERFTSNILKKKPDNINKTNITGGATAASKVLDRIANKSLQLPSYDGYQKAVSALESAILNFDEKRAEKFFHKELDDLFNLISEWQFYAYLPDERLKEFWIPDLNLSLCEKEKAANLLIDGLRIGLRSNLLTEYHCSVYTTQLMDKIYANLNSATKRKIQHLREQLSKESDILEPCTVAGGGAAAHQPVVVDRDRFSGFGMDFLPNEAASLVHTDIFTHERFVPENTNIIHIADGVDSVEVVSKLMQAELRLSSALFDLNNVDINLMSEQEISKKIYAVILEVIGLQIVGGISQLSSKYQEKIAESLCDILELCMNHNKINKRDRNSYGLNLIHIPRIMPSISEAIRNRVDHVRDKLHKDFKNC